MLFRSAGMGWAIINVNSYPMFVELSSSKNLGKFTGYYYSASQVAQSITPIIIGFVMDFLGYRAYFPYAAIFMTIALVVFSFVKVPKKDKVHNVNNTIKNTNNDESIELNDEKLNENNEEESNNVEENIATKETTESNNDNPDKETISQ